MKAILKFDLLDIDDKVEHERCLKAKDLCNVIWEFTNISRKELEYKVDNSNKLDNNEVLELVFSKFYDLLEENDININNLYG